MKRTVALFAALLVAGCGGGGSSPAVHPAAPGTASKVATQKGTLSLTFGAQNASSARSPKFVSPNAATAVVSVNNSSQTTSNFDVSATSSLCTGATSRTCQLTFNAPVGNNQSISVALLSAASTPMVLGQGSNSVDVVAGTPFSVTVGINPVVAGALGITFSPLLSYTNSGVTTGTVTFTDPSGAPITGSGNVPNFLVPMTLTSSDPHVTFTLATLTTPGQTFSVNYDGSAAVHSQVTIAIQLGTTVVASNILLVPGLVVNRTNLGAIGTVNPQEMAIGPDGNVYVAEENTNSIAKINGTTGALIATFPSGFASGHPIGIATGGDGNLYYSDSSSCQMGRMNTSGAAPSPPLVTTVGSTCALRQMAHDNSGNVWYLDQLNNDVGFIVPGSWPGGITTCPVTLTASAFLVADNGIIAAADGSMWFTESYTSKIGHITNIAACTTGVSTEIPVPGINLADLFGIALGSDNNLWFTAVSAPLYGKVTPGGVLTTYPGLFNPNVFGNMVAITVGSDGNMWVPQGGGAASFNPVTPTLPNTQYFTDNGQTDNHFALYGPNGNVWFSGIGSNPPGNFTPTQDEVAQFAVR